MAKTTKRQVREVKNDCSWFDTDNARLIILCALFGVVGAHKFAMGKKGQGWLFIILDLTIIGIIVSAVWAFIDLLFLTIKKDNKPGNMIMGSFFLMCGMVLPLTVGCGCPNPTIVEVGKVQKSSAHVAGKVGKIEKEPFWQGNLRCEDEQNLTMDLFVRLFDSKAYFAFGDKAFSIPLKTKNVVNANGGELWFFSGVDDENQVNFRIIVENGGLYTSSNKNLISINFIPTTAGGVEHKYGCYVVK